MLLGAALWCFHNGTTDVCVHVYLTKLGCLDVPTFCTLSLFCTPYYYFYEYCNTFNNGSNPVERKNDEDLVAVDTMGCHNCISWGLFAH